MNTPDDDCFQRSVLRKSSEIVTNEVVQVKISPSPLKAIAIVATISIPRNYIPLIFMITKFQKISDAVTHWLRSFLRYSYFGSYLALGVATSRPEERVRVQVSAP